MEMSITKAIFFMCNAFWSVTGKVLNTSGQKINTFIEIIDNCSVSSQL